MAVDHRRIKEIIGDSEESSDTSLRGNALRRASNGQLPRTMTPFEWEQWYLENGIPGEHNKTQEEPRKVTRWDRVKGVFRLGKGT